MNQFGRLRWRFAFIAGVIALGATGCDWISAEPGMTNISITEDDVPVVRPLTVDPADLDVPSEMEDWISTWNGEPFSWQCYDPQLAAALGRDLGDQPVEPIEAVVTATSDVFLRVSYTSELLSDESADANPLCWGSPSFTLARQLDGNPIYRRPGCQLDLFVDGAPAKKVSGSFISEDVVVGPLPAGTHILEVRAVACVGYQDGLGRQVLEIEQLEITSQQTFPHAPVTTVATPIPYPTVSPTEPECPPNTDNPVLRGDLAYTFWRLAGLPTGLPPNTFEDVPASAFYAPAVDYVVWAAITTGTSSTTFSPADGVTRAQYVALAWRYAGGPSSTASIPYTDIPENRYYTDAVRWAVETGAMAGTSPTTFSPDDLMQHVDAETVAQHFDPSFDYFTCPTA